MNDMVNKHEVISALADGQLHGEEFARAVESVTADAQALATWHAYHVVGDVLRSGELAACRQDVAFIARLKTRLQQEQIQVPSMSAMDSVAASAYSTRSSDQNSAKKRAANEASFRWKLVAGFASLAAVAAISWNGLAGSGQASSPPQLAQAVMPVQPQAVQPAVTVADSEPPVMIRDPRLDAFVAAHEQFGGTSALQMPAGFLRNATFEGQAR
ncbi:MAG: sigma-E factor negative regulatory protein [Rhodoferax sp.]|nr:sigma-E factor negative regulatory protein [Rhodoferax sp.]